MTISSLGLRLGQFIKKNTFRKEIVIVIVLKIVAIFLLWGFFFHHPERKKLTVEELATHYVSMLNKH